MELPGFSNLDGLTDLGARSGVDMRPTLIRVLTDLYVQKLGHTPDEERHYTELALRLLDAVDVQTRAAVAARLARHLSPPIRIIHRLAKDLPEVAAALRPHPLLQPAEGAGPTAPRAPVAPAVEAAAPAEPAKPKRESDAATGAPGMLDAAAANELNELFFAAPANERRLILLNLDVVAPAPEKPAGVSLDPAVAQRLETTALARNREDFTKHLAAALRVSREQAQRIARDDLGEPIVVAAKALGIPREVLYRILMFLNPVVGHSVERVHALAELFDEMTVQAAEDMVAVWQALHSSERAAAKHHPLLWDDEGRPRQRPPTPAQRAPVAPRVSQRRDAS